MYIPAGLTWKLQPLDLGYHKLLKDELKKLWLRDQALATPSEKQQRECVSKTLKEIFFIMNEKNNHVFWDKAGLVYPYEDIWAQNRNQRDHLEQGIIDEGEGNNDRMLIEEENLEIGSQSNFSEMI